MLNENFKWPKGTKDKTIDDKRIVDFNGTEEGSIEGNKESRKNLKLSVKEAIKEWDETRPKGAIDYRLEKEKVERKSESDIMADKRVARYISAENKNPRHKRQEIERRGNRSYSTN
jgi:hypothetical protein